MRVRTDRWRRGVPRAQIVKISVHFFLFQAAIIYQIVKISVHTFFLFHAIIYQIVSKKCVVHEFFDVTLYVSLCILFFSKCPQINNDKLSFGAEPSEIGHWT